MGRSLSMSLLVAGACCCALVFVVDGLPAERRFKRQTTTDNASSPSPDTGIKLKVVPDESTSDSSLSTQSTPTSSSSPSTSSQRPSTNNNFGLGAVAGIGGLTRGVGIGNFHLPDATKNDPLAPWGAFAGLNLGDGARIGAGCQGLSCGVQLGHFVLATPQLLGLGRNFLNPNQRQDQNQKSGKSGVDGKSGPEETQTLSETNFNPNPGSLNNFSSSSGNPEDIRLIFRDAFRGFRDTLASFFRAPVTHFIKKDRAFQIDNSTESVVGAVKSAASEPKTYRIQLTPPRSSSSTNEDGKERENELD